MSLLDDLEELQAAIALAVELSMAVQFELPEDLPEEEKDKIRVNWEKLGGAVALGVAEPMLQHIIDHGGTGGGTPGIGGGPAFVDIPLAINTVRHGDGLQVASGQFWFDASLYTAITAFKLQVVAWASGTTGTLARARLWNISDNEYVTSANVSTTSSGTQLIVSSALTVGSGAGNLRSASKLYEIRLDVEDGVLDDDAALFGSVCLRLEV